jgi:hypothetical protein
MELVFSGTLPDAGLPRDLRFKYYAVGKMDAKAPVRRESFEAALGDLMGKAGAGGAVGRQGNGS